MTSTSRSPIGWIEFSVRMHFLLMSPKESKNINVEWPEWIRKEESGSLD